MYVSRIDAETARLLATSGPAPAHVEDEIARVAMAMLAAGATRDDVSGYIRARAARLVADRRVIARDLARVRLAAVDEPPPAA